MTTAQPDRLDRIEALLERMALESEQSKRDSNERMTRIEQLSESNNRFLEAFTQRIDRFEDRIEELAQSQQATSRDVAQLVTIQQQSSQALNEAMIRLTDTQEGVVRLLGSLDEDRPTILRKLNTIEGKVDSLLQQQNQS